MDGRITIDEAMMGCDWRGDADDMRAFAADLAEITGDDVRVADSHNGGDTEERISDEAWQQAILNSPDRCWIRCS